MFGPHKRHSQITVSVSSTFRALILSAAKNPRIGCCSCLFDRQDKYISTKSVYDTAARENVVERRRYLLFVLPAFCKSSKELSIRPKRFTVSS